MEIEERLSYLRSSRDHLGRSDTDGQDHKVVVAAVAPTRHSGLLKQQISFKAKMVSELAARKDFLGAAAAQEEVVALEKELCALRAESTSTILGKQLAEKCKAVDELVKLGNYAGAAAAQK